MFIICTYQDDYRGDVRLGDTLRMLARFPDNNTWTGTVSILTALGAAATDTQALTAHTGGRVQDRDWDLSADYNTSTIPLIANTTYIASLQMTSGSKTIEINKTFRVLPQGA